MDSLTDHVTQLTHRYNFIHEKWEKLVEETGKSKLRQLPSEIVDSCDLRSSFKNARRGYVREDGDTDLILDHFINLLCAVSNTKSRQLLITTADDATTHCLNDHILQFIRQNNFQHTRRVYCLFETDSPHQNCDKISTWDHSTGFTIVTTTSAVASHHRFIDSVGADLAVIIMMHRHHLEPTK